MSDLMTVFWLVISDTCTKNDLQQKQTFIGNMPRYVIFNNTYSYNIISIQSFDINNGTWDTVDILYRLPERKLLGGSVHASHLDVTELELLWWNTIELIPALMSYAEEVISWL